MKGTKYKKAYRRGALLAVIALVLPAAAFALSPSGWALVDIEGLRSGEEVTIRDGESVSSDLTIGGGDVTISGSVNGDLVAGGANIFVDGVVTQDINALGGQVFVEGIVEDDVRIVGVDVVIGGTIDDNLSIVGGAVTVKQKARIGGDILVAGGDVEVAGTVDGSLQVNGGEVLIDGPVAGDVVINAGEVEIGSQANIQGDISYRAKNKATISPDAVIAGEVEFRERTEGVAGMMFAGKDGGALALRFLSLLAGALLVGLAIRNVSTKVIERGVTHVWWRYLLIGFALLVLVPIGSVVLFATAVGVPLGFLFLFWFGAYLLLAWFYAAVFTGSVLWKWVAREEGVRITWQSVVIGTLIYELLTFIPIFGWAIQLVIYLVALGALGAVGWSTFRAER